MGDATIHLLIDADLAADDAGATRGEGGCGGPAPSSRSAFPSFRFRSLSRAMPADSTLAELMDFVLARTKGDEAASRDGRLRRLTVVDTSYHPAKSVSTEVQKYTRTSGPFSVTLYDMGWYPSGNVVVLPSPLTSPSASEPTPDGRDRAEAAEDELLKRFAEWRSRNLASYEEFACNNGGGSMAGENGHSSERAAGGLQWIGAGAKAHRGPMKPSEILDAAGRESDRAAEAARAAEARPTVSGRPTKKKPRRTDRERVNRIDSLIRDLEAAESIRGGKKKKSVSQKVRTIHHQNPPHIIPQPPGPTCQTKAMVVLLEPGDEAETCLMAGRGMNGLKGVIVCFNPNTQRYTLELEKGDMLSLKIRNIRKIVPEPSDDNDLNSPPNTTLKSPDDGAFDSSLPIFPLAAKEESPSSQDDDNSPEEPREAGESAGVVSPMTAVLVLLVTYLYSKGNNGNSDYNPKALMTGVYAYHNDYDHGVSVPVLITFVVLSYLSWEWGTKPRSCDDRGEFKWTNLYLRLSFCYPCEILGISALIMWSLEFRVHHIASLSILGFFVWKLGPRMAAGTSAGVT